MKEWYGKSKRTSDGVPRTISSSPWWVTHSRETDDVFLWKNGERLKVLDGDVPRSAGPVTNASHIEDAPGAVLVSHSKMTLCI